MQKALHRQKFLSLSLATLGVVYGDIGTSPLYAMRESLSHTAVSSANIFGVLSLIFWALTLLISVKYLLFIMRANNDGEGGPIALLSLFKPWQFKHKKSYIILLLLGLLGTSLLFGDGMITPAISVLSAVEGLSIVEPRLHGLVVPLAFFILLFLFAMQSRGSERVGFLFGPVIAIWFVSIGILGLWSIIQHPMILKAINPWYGIILLEHSHWTAGLILTGVFLAVTGGEALYADISHFGVSPIRWVWYCFVFPALLLNYFGQGADLLFHPEHLKNPFFLLAPHRFLLPLLFIATLATIIASQAVISAVFSLAKQAIALQYLPRMNVVFSSHEIKGQVYVPAINFITALGTLALLLTFQTSSNLANAYGLAVNMNMVIVTFLATLFFYRHWHWPLLKVILFGAFFLWIDITFLGANSLKILHKGWFPVVFGIIGTLLMLTWRRGLKLLRQASALRKITIKEIAQKIYTHKITRIPGIAVFINEPYDESKSCVSRQMESNHTLHEVTVLLDVVIADKPIVDIHNRVERLKQMSSIYHVRLHYGFMQAIDIPNTLRVCTELKILPFLEDEKQFFYFLEMVKTQINPELNIATPLWQKRLFSALLNNLTQHIDYYHLPRQRTTLIGTYYEI